MLVHRLRRWPNIEPTQDQRVYRAGCLSEIYVHLYVDHGCLGPVTSPANLRRLPKVGSMLGQRRRRWANIDLTLGDRLHVAGDVF